MAFKPIQIVINAKDNASAVLGRLEKGVKAVGLAVAGYLGIRAFASGIQGAAEFEAAMSRVKAATDGTAEEMTALTQAAQNAGSNTKYTSVQAAGALENLAKAGLSAGDSIKALPAVLALAQAGDVELATASEYVTKAVMGMGLAFDDAGRVADVLAKGANATNTSVEGLAQALSYAAPVANSLGVSLESTVAIIGKFADAGIDASRAGTALNSIMSQFANPASKFRQELGAAGIVTTDFDKALRQLAASGPAGERAINAVGLEAGPALRALLNQGMGALDGLTDSLRNAQGSAEAVARTMADNLQGSLTGLGSVWDAVVTALNTPVLPVLKQGVDALAGSLRRLVDDGSVTRMGQVLATAFDNGIQGVQKFLGALDVNQIILRMQVMASEVGEAFQRITTFATNAGNAVRMAWGVMSAGTSGVMAVIYKVGEAFAGVASNIQSGVALIMDGLSRITFGGVSASFKQAAAEIRLSAEATWASSQALAAKADESFNAMAEGAELARDGWAGLTETVEQAAPAAAQTGEALQQLAQGVEAVAQAQNKAVPAAQAKAQADAQAAQAVKQLRDEYAELVASGNMLAAARTLIEIDRIQRRLAGSAEAAAESAALIDQAYADLGLETPKELQRLADQASAAFKRLEKDGTQPPQRIAQAWQVMAERTIAANGGIAPAWLKTEAAVKGYEIALDRAGKAVVSTERATARAAGRMVSDFDKVGRAADRASQRIHNMRRAADSPDGDGAKPFGSPNIAERGTTNPIQNLVPANIQTEAELDAWWKEWQRQYKEQNPFDVKSRGQLGNYQMAVTRFAMEGARKQIQMQQAVKAAGQPAQAAAAPMPEVSTAQQLVTQVHRHEISLGGRELGAIQTDAAGSSVLQSLLGELERSARLTGAPV
ncbi:Phage-related minor tail protein [Comamonas aquatica]|uniref:phage tail tape measure protein n=1 Tax=Comamonas aquatica TaxID=225991 RepID=UPI001EF27094|nr:phage tail tape measure protein [Comamonas aquatica]CAB5689095.1 Phage-related minor tail protein [Comamonas aquatica]CAC9212382.1 Phage-related minor tail protein [Comamonas aquatica]